LQQLWQQQGPVAAAYASLQALTCCAAVVCNLLLLLLLLLHVAYMCRRGDDPTDCSLVSNQTMSC
jgi:hypothetical protein